MGEWAWAAGIAPLLGPWRFGAVQLVYQREGGFDPHKQLDVLSRHEATNVFTTPTAMRSMMAIGDAGTRYPQKFRIVCSAGEPLNPEAIRWFREQYGLTVLDYYGLTESYPLCANYPFMDVREGSMGRPMPGWDVQILDEDEQPVPQGERGEICLRARSNPHYPLGYWNNDEAAQETFGGEWFHTKDAARFDEDGYVWYEGRADDVIIAAGYRIGPFEVESACLEHPAVKEAAAVASPDERRGSIVKAFIVLAEGHEGSDELVERDPGARALAAVGLRVSAQDRVRRRPAEDADRQDPPDRAAPARARGDAAARDARGPGRAGLAAARPVTRALMPQWLARLGRARRARLDRRARVAADGRRAERPGARCCGSPSRWRRRSRCCSPAARLRAGARVLALPAVAAGARCSPATRCRAPGSSCCARATGTSWSSGLGGGLQALGTVRLPYVSADPWPRIVLELLGAELLILAGPADLLAARVARRGARCRSTCRSAAIRSSRWRC